MSHHRKQQRRTANPYHITNGNNRKRKPTRRVPPGLAGPDHRFGNTRQHVHPREAVITQDSLRWMIIFWNLTFPQDTQIVTGTVLVVKCQTYDFKLF